jgi:hypothetical protein
VLSIGGDCKKSTDPDNNEIQQGGIYVDIYDPEKACIGTTLFSDLHDSQNPRIIEVDNDSKYLAK